MAYLFRRLALFVQVGQPSHQVFTGVLLVPGGLLLAWWAQYGDPYYSYPYFIAAGLILAIFGFVLLVKGLGRLFKQPRTAQPVSNNPVQYQQAYSQPQPAVEPIAPSADTAE